MQKAKEHRFTITRPSTNKVIITRKDGGFAGCGLLNALQRCVSQELDRQDRAYIKFLEDGGPGVHHEYTLSHGRRVLCRADVRGLQAALKKMTGERRFKCPTCEKWTSTRKERRCEKCYLKGTKR